MVDARPLLFANMLVLMLLVLAGFARFQSAIPGLPLMTDTPTVSFPPSQTMAAATEASSSTGNRISVASTADTASLSIHLNVVPDEVGINGRDYDFAPGSAELHFGLQAGSYRIVAGKAGYATWDASVQLVTGDERLLVAELVPAPKVHHSAGTWKDGTTTGTGRYEAEGLRYEGEFVDAQFHGEGKSWFADGSVYSGEWIKGKPHGQGGLRFANGDTYSGEFVAGVYSGEGVLTTAGGDVYAGRWANGDLNGSGTLTSSEGLLYVGGFQGGEFHGEGTLTYPDGRYYEGNFKGGRFHGQGSLIFADGKQYQGQFRNGRYHGEGDLLNLNGSRISGNFRHGEPYGEAKLFTTEGETFIARADEPGVCYRPDNAEARKCPALPGW